MDIPTIKHDVLSKIHLIGGEKGGVGKSMVSRLLAQYFIDQQIPFIGFDTDRSHGSLMRFYADYASPALVDRYEALDAIIEAAVEQPGRRVLVDLAAQTHDPLVRWMDDSGVLDMADVSGIALHYWHVMDSGRDSVDLLTRLLDRFGQRLHYVLVRNQLRGDDFTQLERSGQLERARGLGARVMDLKKLQDTVVQKIDARNASFWSARQGGSDSPGLGLMERQRLKMWMSSSYASLSALGRVSVDAPEVRMMQVNGLRMRVTTQGQGPLVLLCHGFPEHPHSWRHQIAALSAAGYCVAAPDMRGYGATDAPADVDLYTLPHLVGDMVDLVKALGQTQAVIVGHDWGAAVAWNSALLRPDLFRAVAGLSVPYAPPGKVDLLTLAGAGRHPRLLHPVLPDPRRGRGRTRARPGREHPPHPLQRLGRRPAAQHRRPPGQRRLPLADRRPRGAARLDDGRGRGRVRPGPLRPAVFAAG